MLLLNCIHAVCFNIYNLRTEVVVVQKTND
jgi:hypothetical protein